jgi:hypothetical protein
MTAGAELQAAVISALDGVAGLGRVYDGPPVQAAVPYAVVEPGAEADWGHKSGAGREVRLAVTIRDEGERPARLRRLMGEAEAALAGLAAVAGWQLVTMRFLSSRVAKDRQGGWIGLVEFRARLLAGEGQ